MAEGVWSIRFAALAAVFSAVAAVSSLAVSCQERPTPYKVALYSARWEAIRDYAESTARFQSALERVSLSVRLTVDSPEPLAKMSDDQMIEAAAASRPINEAWADLIAAESRDLAPWSTDTARAVNEAEAAAGNASLCFKILGGQLDLVRNRPDWWRFIRQKAEGPCRDIHKNEWARKFDSASEWALRLMTDEVRSGGDQFVPGEKRKPLD